MNFPSTEIVPAEPGDIDVLFEIYCDVVASGGAQPRGGVSTRQVFVEGWVRERAVYVARQDGKAVGGYFLRSNFPAFAAHISQGGYLVARACRCSGIGTELLDHSLREAHRLGFTAMMFNLVQEHNPSRRLYERAGFVVIGRIPQVHDNDDGIIYWRDLTGYPEIDQAERAGPRQETAADSRQDAQTWHRGRGNWAR